MFWQTTVEQSTFLWGNEKFSRADCLPTNKECELGLDHCEIYPTDETLQ